MATQQFRVLVFQEEGAWIAQSIDYDIGAQAPDFESLMRRFDLAVQVELEESRRRTARLRVTKPQGSDDAPFAGINAAPAYIRAMWEPDHRDHKRVLRVIRSIEVG